MKHLKAFKDILAKYLATSWKEQVSSPQISHRGFTLVEVLASILIATVFVATAMQAMVIATLFKARAQEYSEATTWIQEDLENVMLQASEYDNSARCTALTPSGELGPNNGYADGFSDSLHSINPETRTGDASSVPDRDTITPTKTSLSSDKEYSFTRISVPLNTAPYAVLTLTYSVAPPRAHTTLVDSATATSTAVNVVSASGFKAGNKLTVGTDTDNSIQSISGNTITLSNQLGTAQPLNAVVDASIATLSTEVIPDAAFECT